MAYRKGYCNICLSDHCASIDALLRDGRSINSIANEFGFDKRTVENHLRKCGITKGQLDKLKRRYKEEMGKSIPTAERAGLPSTIEAKRVELNVSTLSENIKVLYTSCLQVMAECEETGKHKLRLAAIREARQILEMVLKASAFVLDDTNETDWKDTLAVILVALEPFPEAKLAVAKALDSNL